MSQETRHIPRLVWLLALIGAALNFGTAILRLGNFFPTPRLIDFGAFYASSWALRLGVSPYSLSRESVEQIIARTAMPLAPPPIFNPPVWPLLTYPFTFLSYTPAAFAWILLNLAMLAIVTYLLTDIAGLHGWKLRVICFAVVVTFGPVFLDLSIGQNSTFLLLMAALAGWVLRRTALRFELIASAAVALATGAKLFPLFWSGAFFLLRRWRLFLLTFAMTGALLALSYLLLPTASRDYLFVQFPGRLTSSVQSISINDQTLTAWLMRLFRPQMFSVQGISAFELSDVSWTPFVTLNEQAVTAIGYALLLAISGTAAICIWRCGNPIPEAGLFLWVLVGLLAFPHMERYNHALLLPAMAWLWPRGVRGVSIAVLAYFLSGMARLTHLWAMVLPGPLAALFSGFGVLATLVLTGGMMLEMTRSAAVAADMEHRS